MALAVLALTAFILLGALFAPLIDVSVLLSLCETLVMFFCRSALLHMFIAAFQRASRCMPIAMSANLLLESGDSRSMLSKPR